MNLKSIKDLEIPLPVVFPVVIILKSLVYSVAHDEESPLHNEEGLREILKDIEHIIKTGGLPVEMFYFRLEEYFHQQLFKEYILFQKFTKEEHFMN